MNPDAFIPLYGNDFFQAVEGQPDYVVAAYLRAIWHFWHHHHCRGLKDDQAFLRRLCRVDAEQWPEVMSFVFDNEKQFTLGEDGLWRQTRAVKEWDKAKEIYDLNIKRTQAATAARKAKGGKR